MIQECKEGADEDDGGEHGKGEHGERRAGCAKRTEDERGAIDRVGEKRGDDGGGGVEDALAERPLDDKEGEENLQRETPGDGAPADGAAVRREGPGEREKDGKAEEAGESGQGRSPMLRAEGM